MIFSLEHLDVLRSVKAADENKTQDNTQGFWTENQHKIKGLSNRQNHICLHASVSKLGGQDRQTCCSSTIL